MNAALATYGAALRRAASGAPTPIDLVRPGGDPVRLLRRCGFGRLGR